MGRLRAMRVAVLAISLALGHAVNAAVLPAQSVRLEDLDSSETLLSTSESPLDLGAKMPSQPSLMDQASAMAYEGEQQFREQNKELGGQMDKGEAQLQAWTREKEFKVDGGMVGFDGAKLAHQQAKMAEQKLAQDKAEFNEQLKEKTTVYRADGTKVAGDELTRGIVPKGGFLPNHGLDINDPASQRFLDP